MGFRQLVTQVQQAEAALEAQERRVSADWRQLKASWRDTWTPGRIVVAGLIGGFLAGRAQPLRAAARGRHLMQLVTMLSGLFAGGRAHEAADEAEHAAAAHATAATASKAVPESDTASAAAHPGATAAATAPRARAETRAADRAGP